MIQNQHEKASWNNDAPLKNQKRKKVLIVSYLFSQNNAIGAVRIRGLAKYLPLFGWEPTILTVTSPFPIDSIIKIHSTPEYDTITEWKRRLGFDLNTPIREQFGLKTYKNRNSLSNVIVEMVKEVIAYPDNHKGWYPYALQEGKNILANERFDALLSSSGPETSHLVAHQLKKLFKIPWIADFRDLWTQNHLYSYSSIRKFFEERLERDTLAYADTLTIISEPLAKRLGELHPGKKIYSIPNGFDPQLKNPGTLLSKKFSILYTGQLYKGKRDPEPLFRTLRELADEGSVDLDDVSIEFFGWPEEWLMHDVEKYHLEGVVAIHGLIPREEAILRQRSSQILLSLIWDHPAEKGVYTGKIFEYLAAKRPILSLGTPGGVVEDLLRVTHAGVHVSSFEELHQELITAYRAFKSTGEVPYHGIESEIDHFSHREMAGQFARVLDSINIVPL